MVLTLWEWGIEDAKGAWNIHFESLYPSLSRTARLDDLGQKWSPKMAGWKFMGPAGGQQFWRISPARMMVTPAPAKIHHTIPRQKKRPTDALPMNSMGFAMWLDIAIGQDWWNCPVILGDTPKPGQNTNFWLAGCDGSKPLWASILSLNGFDRNCRKNSKSPWAMPWAAPHKWWSRIAKTCKIIHHFSLRSGHYHDIDVHRYKIWHMLVVENAYE